MISTALAYVVANIQCRYKENSCKPQCINV